MGIKIKFLSPFILSTWCSLVMATAPGVCIRGSCLINPAGGLILGPVKPKAQIDGEIPQPYSLVPATSMTGSIGKYAIVAERPLTQAIFVGSTWHQAPYKVAGMDTFLSGWDGSDYAKLLSEYLPVSQGSIHYAGFSFLDIHEAMDEPGFSNENDIVPTLNLNITKPIQSGMSSVVNFVLLGLETGRYQAAADGERNYFILFTDTPASTATTDSSDISCADNTFVMDWAVLRPVYFSIVYKPNQASGCAIEDMITGHSPELSAIAATTSRAIANMLTDPTWAGWQDGNWNEIADKCAGQFERPFVVLANGSRWKLSELWSDWAFITDSGLPDQNGKRGCVQGE